MPSHVHKPCVWCDLGGRRSPPSINHASPSVHGLGYTSLPLSVRRVLDTVALISNLEWICRDDAGGGAVSLGPGHILPGPTWPVGPPHASHLILSDALALRFGHPSLVVYLLLAVISLPRGTERAASLGCVPVGMEVTDGRYDACRVKCAGYSIEYLGHRPFLFIPLACHRRSRTAVYPIAAGRMSLPAVYRCRPYRGSSMGDITTRPTRRATFPPRRPRLSRGDY